MKLLTLTALTLFAATNGVLADKKLSYSCSNHEEGLGRAKLIDIQHKDGGVVSDRYAKYIFAEMSTWSGGKYFTKHDRVSGEITVVCKTPVESKDKALEAIAEQEGLVKEHNGQHF